jgi:Na+/H+ antiporter NhaD/arsenite permease-like protein
MIGWLADNWQQVFAVSVFLIAYILIALDKIHKTTVAITGAVLVIIVGILTQEEAFGQIGRRHNGEHIGAEWNTLFLLVGMMIIVNVVRETGLFHWLAVQSVKLARGRPAAMIVLLCAITGLVSAFIDNVTTVLLIAPVTIYVAADLKIDPVPILICEVLASNIGGAATLIGDPPNIIIGGYTGLGFGPFLTQLGLVVIIAFVVFLATVFLFVGRNMRIADDVRRRVMAMDASKYIEDRRLLRISLFVLALTITGFIVHEHVGLEPATIALFGAALILLLSGERPTKPLADVEWTTIFFFLGLFIIVGALVKVGTIERLSQFVLDVTGGNIPWLSMIILWFSAIASGFVDNIPYVATMCPLIGDMATQLNPGMTPQAAMHAPNVLVLWWSLALGACLGGNFTIIGASANVVVSGIAEKRGNPISFARFLRYGVLFTLQSLVIATAYIYIRYLL